MGWTLLNVWHIFELTNYSIRLLFKKKKTKNPYNPSVKFSMCVLYRQAGSLDAEWGLSVNVACCALADF